MNSAADLAATASKNSGIAVTLTNKDAPDGGLNCATEIMWVLCMKYCEFYGLWEYVY